MTWWYFFGSYMNNNRAIVSSNSEAAINCSTTIEEAVKKQEPPDPNKKLNRKSSDKLNIVKNVRNKKISLDNNNDSSKKLADKQSKYSRITMILSWGRELVCVLALILTTYASMQNSPPKVSRAPNPVPFFSKGSLVHDFPTGILGPTQTRVSLSELSLVLYYAPWCAESQNSRNAYEHVARLFYKEAHFAAINCWQPGGECRSQYSKVHSWPVLMAYQPNGLAVQYHGPWTEAALSRFILSLINPMKRLSDPDDLMQLMTGKDAVVVAFLDVTKHKLQYSKYYQTSLKWLEKDAFQEISFAIVTGETAIKFGVTVQPSIRVYLWNETLEYNGNSSWTSKELTKWVNSHIQCVSMWLGPPGSSKSSSIAPYLNQGPVMFLFTPRNFYVEFSDAYSMLRQIGMEYYNCNNDNWVSEMAREYIADQRRENLKSFQNLRKQCSAVLRKNLQTERKNDKNCVKSDSVSVSFVNVLNSSNDGKNKQFQDEFCEVNCKFDCKREEENLCKVQEKSKYEIYSEEYNQARPKTSMINNDFDYRSPEHLKRRELRKSCELLHLSDREGGEVFFETPDEKDNLEMIAGMSCKTNKTFSIIAIDSALYHVFAERLGTDVLHENNKTVAIIVDHEDESTFVLKENINLNEIVQLMNDYYKRLSKRFMRSNNISFKNTHYFDVEEFQKERHRIYKSRTENREMVKDYTPPQHIYLREINSHDFDDVVIKSNKTTVVLFSSAQCAFCSPLSQHMLTLSRILKDQPNLEFVRIDGDKNDLSWEYTMELFPSLIVFPAKRKSESRIFSNKISANIQNLLGFVLSNLERPLRLHAIVLACKYSQRITSQEDCKNVLATEISDDISQSLRDWRRMPHKRRLILRRLQLLKKFYLNLLCMNHSCDFNLLEKNAKSIVKIWNF